MINRAATQDISTDQPLQLILQELKPSTQTLETLSSSPTPPHWKKNIEMMQRWCCRLRSLAALRSSTQLHHLRPSPAARLLHTSPNLFHRPSIITPLIAPTFSSHISASVFPSHISHSPLSLIQVRHITLKQRKRKLKSRKPMTPIISKVKKIKIKGYSSYKGRFRLMHDGQIRRWKEGKRHNAFSKSKKSKRRLRQPGVVPAAYAKVMKKLNFGA